MQTGPESGTQLEARAAVGPQDLMATGPTSSGNKLSSSQKCRFSVCSSWQEKGFRKTHAWGTQRQPLTYSLLGINLTTLRKGHSFGNGAFNSLHAWSSVALRVKGEERD